MYLDEWGECLYEEASNKGHHFQCVSWVSFVGRFIKPIILTIFFSLKHQNTPHSTTTLILIQTPMTSCLFLLPFLSITSLNPKLQGDGFIILYWNVRSRLPSVASPLLIQNISILTVVAAHDPICMATLSFSRKKKPNFYRHYWFLSKHADRPI